MRHVYTRYTRLFFWQKFCCLPYSFAILLILNIPQMHKRFLMKSLNYAHRAQYTQDTSQFASNFLSTDFLINLKSIFHWLQYSGWLQVSNISNILNIFQILPIGWKIDERHSIQYTSRFIAAMMLSGISELAICSRDYGRLYTCRISGDFCSTHGRSDNRGKRTAAESAVVQSALKRQTTRARTPRAVRICIQRNESLSGHSLSLPLSSPLPLTLFYDIAFMTMCAQCTEIMNNGLGKRIIHSFSAEHDTGISLEFTDSPVITGKSLIKSTYGDSTICCVAELCDIIRRFLIAQMFHDSIIIQDVSFYTKLIYIKLFFT